MSETLAPYIAAQARVRALSGALEQAVARRLRDAVDLWMQDIDKGLGALAGARAKDMQATRAVIKQASNRLHSRLTAAIKEQRNLTFAEVEKIMQRNAEKAVKLAGGAAAVGRVSIPNLSMAGAFDSLGAAQTWTTLVAGHVANAAADANAYVTSAILRGDSVHTVRRGLRKYVQGSEDLATTDLRRIPPAQRGAARRMAYNADRIAYTEIHNARAEAEVQHFQRDPLVKAVRWVLSPNRGTTKRPDECDVLARANFYGLGPGVYPVNRVPRPPHPFDRCERIPITRPAKESKQAKPDPPLKVDPLKVKLPKSITSKLSKAELGRVRKHAQAAVQFGAEAIGKQAGKVLRRAVQRGKVAKAPTTKVPRGNTAPKKPRGNTAGTKKKPKTTPGNLGAGGNSRVGSRMDPARRAEARRLEAQQQAQAAAKAIDDVPRVPMNKVDTSDLKWTSHHDELEASRRLRVALTELSDYANEHLGVNLMFADDFPLQQAQQAVHRLREIYIAHARQFGTKVQWPQIIEFGEDAFSDPGVMGWYRAHDRRIAIRPDALDAGKVEHTVREGWFSSYNTARTIDHELAHFWDHMKNPKHFDPWDSITIGKDAAVGAGHPWAGREMSSRDWWRRKLGIGGPEGQVEARLAAQVSKYAKTNPMEFKAEVMSAIMDGRELSDEVLALYRKWGGPEPFRIRNSATRSASSWRTEETLADMRRAMTAEGGKTAEQIEKHIAQTRVRLMEMEKEKLESLAKYNDLPDGRGDYRAAQIGEELAGETPKRATSASGVEIDNIGGPGGPSYRQPDDLTPGVPTTKLPTGERVVTANNIIKRVVVQSESGVNTSALAAQIREAGRFYVEVILPIGDVNAGASMLEAVNPSGAVPSKGAITLGANMEIIDGRHRFVAARKAGKKTIRALVPWRGQFGLG